MSDDNGSFSASPVVVANYPAAPTSTTTLTIPNAVLGTVTYGTGYRFRVVSSTPVKTSTNITAAVTIGTNTPTLGSNINQPGIYSFCPNSGLKTITATPTGTGGTGIIEWYTGSAANAPVDGPPGSNHDVPTTSTPVTYYVTQTINSCKSAKASVNVITSSPNTAPNVTYPTQAFCPGQGAATMTATPTSTGVASTIRWIEQIGATQTIKTGAAISTPQTTGTYNYTVSQFDAQGCLGASVKTFSVTVNAKPTSTSINSVASYCENESRGALTAVLGSDATSLKWYDLTNNVQYTTLTIPAPTTPKTYQYQVTQSNGICESDRSATLTFTVNAKAAAPDLLANASGPFCQNSGLQTITATGQNIEWLSSAATNASVLLSGMNSFTVSTDGNVTTRTVYFRQKNGCYSDVVTKTITINPTPAKSAIPSTIPTYCSDDRRQLTVTVLTNVTKVVWYPNQGTANEGSSILGPTQTTTYQIGQFIGSCEGPRSDSFTVTVTPKPSDPSLDNSTIGPFCQNSGTGATQTIKATSTGTTEWFTSLTAPAAYTTGNSLQISTAGGNVPVYFRQVVDGCPSSRVSKTITITGLPGTPTSAQSRTYCAGDAVTPLTATEPGVLWYTSTRADETGTKQAPTPSTDASNVGKTQLFYLSQTVASCESQQRQQVSVTVKRKPDQLPSISAAFCRTYAPSSLSAQPESGATLIWVDNGKESGTAPVTPNNMDPTYTYQVLQILDGCRSTPAPVTVTVKPTPGQPGIKAYSLCVGRESRPLQVIGTELKYFDANDVLLGTTAPSPSTTQATTVSYKVSQSLDGCEGPKITYSVAVNPIPANPGFTQPKEYCAEEAAAPLVANGQGLLWYTSATTGTGSGQAPTPSTAASNVGSNQTFYVTQTVLGCESTRQAISVTVKRKPSLPTTTPNVEFCQTYSAPTLTATPESGASIIWLIDGRESATGPTPQNSEAKTYTYQVLQELNGCRSNQATVNVRVKQTPGQPGITPFQLCQLSPGRALVANGSDLKYYDSNNTFLGTTAPVVNTDAARTVTYKVSQSLEGCEGPKIDYAIVVQPKPTPPATQAVTYCLESSNNPDQPKQTVQPLTAQGQNLRWYFVDGNAFPENFTPVPAVSNTYAMDYRVTQTVNGCISDQALLRVTVQANPAPVVSTSLVTYCRNEVARPLEATGTNLRWIDPAGVLSSQTPTPQTLNATKGGEAYQVYSISNIGCVSPRSTIRLVVNTNPTLGLLGSTTVNYGQSAQLKLVFTSSPPYTYTLTDGTSGVANDTVSTVAVKPLQTTTYRVESVSNVCGNGLPGNPATATIFVNIPTISTQAMATSVACAGSNFAVTYTTTGVFNAGNAFKVQVADTTSKNYVDVSPTSTASTLTATLPASLKGGVYFVRVVATNPGAEVVGQRSPTILTVRGLPAAVLSGTQNIYEGSAASLSLALTGDGPWTISYTSVVDGVQSTSATFSTNANPHSLSVQPLKTASYFLTAISNNCGTGPVSGTAIVTVLPLLAVENPLLNTVSLYPVPTQNLLTVAIDLPLTPQAPAQLTLRDMAGLPILNRQTDTRQTTIDLSQQPAGLYLLTIQVGEHRLVRKVMKL
ncbi:T9SS type A sorting domain-containing protein [Fibrella sp. USSR17]